MIFDVDKTREEVQENLEAIAPWDFSLQIEGVNYPTRRPTVATIARFKRMKTASGKEAAALGEELFSDPKPPSGSIDGDALIIALAGYLSYFSARAAKNSPAIAALVKSAVEKQLST